MSKKIAIIFDNMVYGGITTVGINYIEILNENGYTVDIYILNPKIQDVIDKISPQNNIYILNFPSILCENNLLRLIEKNNKFIYILPFFMLTIGFYNDFVNKLYYSVKIRKNYDFAIAFSGHINDLTFVEKFIKAKKKIAWAHGAIASYKFISNGFYNLYQKFDTVVTLSKENEYEYLYYQSKKINTQNIYNPVKIAKKIDRMKINELKQKYGEFALFVGRLSKQKDPYTIIDAFKILKNKDIKLLIVGDGPEREKLNKYIDESELNNTIFCLGMKEDIQNYYSAAKIFIHSSPLEGLPTVLIEAMMYELPIIATDSKPGVREVLENGKYGEIVPIQDAKELARKIDDIFYDEKKMIEMKKNGLVRAEAFSFETITTQLLELLK